MNQRELNELRRRFKPDRTAISKVYGCYVSSSRHRVRVWAWTPSTPLMTRMA